jgi:hypothetical protein
MFTLRHRLGMWLASLTTFVCLAYIATDGVAQEKPGTVAPGSIVAKIVQEVPSVETIISNAWVIEWMRTCHQLPTVEPIQAMLNGKDVSIDESTSYMRYGSPLAYARALDLAVTAGFEGSPGSRVFDFGYGSIGHLRMLAFSGHHVAGVDVAPILKLMYTDTRTSFGDGSVQVFDGRFPKEQELINKIGENYDLVISKNVLKRGYVHPAREVFDPRMLIDLGVSDSQFLLRVHNMLKLDGLFVIYNFCPAKAPADKPYIPWADGESPFAKDDFAKAGFEVLHFDVVDHAEARRLGHALGWDSPSGGGMNLQTDLFAWYTIVRKSSITNRSTP